MVVVFNFSFSARLKHYSKDSDIFLSKWDESVARKLRVSRAEGKHVCVFYGVQDFIDYWSYILPAVFGNRARTSLLCSISFIPWGPPIFHFCKSSTMVIFWSDSRVLSIVLDVEIANEIVGLLFWETIKIANLAHLRVRCNFIMYGIFQLSINQRGTRKVLPTARFKAQHHTDQEKNVLVHG